VNPIGVWWRILKWLRSAVAALLVIVGALLVPVGVLGYWADQTVTSPARFEATIGPLVTIPAVQDQVAAGLTSIVKDAWDQRTLTSLLPKASAKAVAAREAAIQKVLPLAMRKVAASPEIGGIWRSLTGAVQTRVLHLASQPTTVTAQAGQVSIDIMPLYLLMRRQVVLAGFPELASVSGPKDHVKMIVKADALDRIQKVYRIANPIGHWLIVLAGLMLLAAVAISRRRRRMVLIVGLLLVVGSGALIVTKSVGAARFDKALATTKLASAGPDIYRQVTGYLSTLTYGLLFLGFVISALGLLVVLRRRGRPEKLRRSSAERSQPAGEQEAISEPQLATAGVPAMARETPNWPVSSKGEVSD